MTILPFPPNLKRWQSENGGSSLQPAVDAFLNEVLAVCQKHGFSISHEDRQGAFEVVPFNDYDAGWFYDAIVERT